jgi:ADP-heptose:LPS heptosyltransferase
MRIGVFRSCAIGDAVQLTPLFQQIKRDYPAAELVFFTSANVEPLLRGAAYLDQLVCFSTAELAAEHQWLNLWRVWGRVAKAGPFDFFLNFEPGWRRAVFLPRVKARRKAGVVYPGWKPLRLYTDVHVVEDAVDRKRHQSTLYLELWAKMSGGRVGAFGYDLSQVLRDEEELPALPEDFIVFAPGTGNFYSTVATKRWPAGHWRELAAQFQSSGRSVVWLGTESDGSLFADALLLNNFMGKLSLRQTVQVIGRSRAFMGRRTRPMWGRIARTWAWSCKANCLVCRAGRAAAGWRIRRWQSSPGLIAWNYCDRSGCSR